MNKLFKNLYEHLKTRKKYNTLMIKYEGAKEDIERLTVQRDTERRVHQIRKEEWEKALKEQEEQIIELKRRRIKNDSNSKKKEQKDN